MKKIYRFVKAKIKLFKIFDWIMIGCGLVGVIVFVVLFFRKSTYINATISVGEDAAVLYGTQYDLSIYTGPKYWLAEAFHKGQVEKDGLGRIRAEVLNVYTYDKTPTNKAVYLNVKLNAVYSRSTNTYSYNGIPVLVGSTIKLNLDNVFAQGLVTEVEGFPNYIPPKTITIETQLREESPVYLGTTGTKNYLADAINVGDVVKDNNGIDMIKVIGKRVVPAETVVTTSDGRIVRGSDPSKKDLYLTLEIATQEKDGKYFFLKNIPVLIDRPIPINTTTVSIFPIVTKFIKY